ncbi:twin-arginine translocase subunit TatC, partial [Veillonella atypica]
MLGHLSELRRRIIIMVVAIIIVTGIAYYYVDVLLDILLAPA